jgi:hypothetical protein
VDATTAVAKRVADVDLHVTDPATVRRPGGGFRAGDSPSPDEPHERRRGDAARSVALAADRDRRWLEGTARRLELGFAAATTAHVPPAARGPKVLPEERERRADRGHRDQARIFVPIAFGTGALGMLVGGLWEFRHGNLMGATPRPPPASCSPPPSCCDGSRPSSPRSVRTGSTSRRRNRETRGCRPFRSPALDSRDGCYQAGAVLGAIPYGARPLPRMPSYAGASRRGTSQPGSRAPAMRLGCRRIARERAQHVEHAGVAAVCAFRPRAQVQSLVSVRSASEPAPRHPVWVVVVRTPSQDGVSGTGRDSTAARPSSRK